MMIGTRCRISFFQYLPLKPTKWGIKVWVLSESKSGYILILQIYTGAKADCEVGLAHRVVMTLMEPYNKQNHKVFMVNFCSSPRPVLFKDLLSCGIYACGTVRSNKKHLPDKVKHKQTNLNVIDLLTQKK